MCVNQEGRRGKNTDCLRSASVGAKPVSTGHCAPREVCGRLRDSKKRSKRQTCHVFDNRVDTAKARIKGERGKDENHKTGQA